ncbi:MAG: UDP-glucose 4-epimerase GalE [Candidatus Latescibacteria bacterium]|nr:UDP-glucose 4-epimerase GalE [Candidatus Latescibacterota bacterium]NIM21657.1 UDP-glucose 4-epimerase GalE [Candidatus Latescibacterota bacterium]NIM64636.1 UDP-glucose 4-epimerase GalE [Candidatus Latescibacterota bacterium]NIO01151.1 UDP-glucose 4-epimerase GalE [Candidatus Latescibacterota bacterium]NIO27544.1 UDP-glucose 4-epimerase GalE [Candidatus Latescibacterota bacterium]
MKLCVTGGAGYIGSVVIERLLEKGHDITVVDDLITGHRDAVPESCRFVEGDIRDESVLKKAFESPMDAVLHFAAKSIVSESVSNPLDYFDNNIGGAVSLLKAMRDRDVKKIIFSSSAAVYGNPQRLPIEESDPCNPENPYGRTKRMIEVILECSRIAWQLGFVSLRYFNAAGSTEQFGEDHRPETHLLPIVLDVALGRTEELTIFGDDYDTPDGTCIRDYIHVIDLAEAHVLALEACNDGFSGVLNLGSDKPHSVLEVVQAVERVTGKKVNYRIGPRRRGDPPALLASSKQAEKVLGWRKRHSKLDDIIRSAHAWRLKHPSGYSR